jgi:hypothetical protein|tara:strand:+ start:1368 stop:3122 length:1755 start_codon:yes stop_codon:yes gene_type:complete
MTPEQIQHAITQLHFDNQSAYSTRGRVRAIMNGGPDGIQALLGDNLKGFQDWQVPVPNLMMSGLEHLSQKIGRIPNLKVDVPNGKDSDRARQKAEKIGRIVNAYDDVQKLDLQMPQVGRWLPGYGFAVWVIREKKDANGVSYPIAELRDPYNCFPGYFGAEQQPKDMSIVRRVPKETLARTYPKYKNQILNKDAYNTNFLGAGNSYASAYTDSYNGSWANSNGDGDLIAEYYNLEGTYIFHMTSATILDFIPNPLDSGPAFVIAKKFSFDRMQGQYDQIIGLMASMAKINVMSIIAMEDAVFTETNISGEIESGQYRKGRFAVNYLAPGTQVSKPASNVPYQIFQQIDRIERQLRVGGSYPSQDDSQSPLSFATGRGLEELGASMSLMIREYHTVMADSIEMIDSKRLEWDKKMYGGSTKALSGYMDNTFYSENYDPAKDISSFQTRRVYGAMAGYDEPQKIVTGLQLLNAGIIDSQTLQENLDGLDNIVRVNERITKEKADKILFETLLSQAQQGDPKATMTVVQIRSNPGNMQNILDKFFTAEEPEIPEAEQSLIQGLPEGAALPPQGAPPGIAQLLQGLGQ